MSEVGSTSRDSCPKRQGIGKKRFPSRLVKQGRLIRDSLNPRVRRTLGGDVGDLGISEHPYQIPCALFYCIYFRTLFS